jgi:uncharacterized protein
MILERLFYTGNQKFFDAFDGLAIQMQKMSKLLHASVHDGKAHAGEHLREMEQLEYETAQQISKLFNELGRTLITPFDREDIHFMATDLSSIGRSILYITKQIRNYGIDGRNSITEIVLAQTEEAVALLAQILNKLKDAKTLSRLTEVCLEMRRILNVCEELVDREAATLLHQEKDEFRMIKMMDHYDVLQKLLTNIGSFVDVSESIIIKYG